MKQLHPKEHSENVTVLTGYVEHGTLEFVHFLAAVITFNLISLSLLPVFSLHKINYNLNSDFFRPPASFSFKKYLICLKKSFKKISFRKP